MIRDFLPSDYAAVVALHEASGDDYRLPPLVVPTAAGEAVHPLFRSAQVLEIGGKIVMFMAGRLQAEMYLLSSTAKWADPWTKKYWLQDLDKRVRSILWLKGIDEVVCYIPPTKKKFVKRVMDWLGYRPPREGWTPLSRPTKETQ